MENKNPIPENQTQSTPISQSSTPHQTIKQKGYFLPIIGALVILLIISGSIYYFMKIKSSTAIPAQTQISIPTPQSSVVDETASTMKFEGKVIVPTDWKTSYETRLVAEGREYELLVLTKGDYKLEIGIISTGLGSCQFYNNKQYVELSNKNLGDFVIRQIPTKENQLLNVCTRDTNGELFAITPFRIIDYTVPPTWEDKTLKEMDTIVESLQK